MSKTTVQPAQLEAAAELMGHVADDTKTTRQKMLEALDQAGDACRCGTANLDNSWQILNSKTQVLESAVAEFGTKLDAAAKAYQHGEDAVALAFIPQTH